MHCGGGCGVVQYPSSASVFKSQNWTAYHCYSQGLLVDMDSYLAFDAANGIESSLILWGCAPCCCRLVCT